MREGLGGQRARAASIEARAAGVASSASTARVVGRIDQHRHGAWFFAAARSMAGPPMSMFSIGLVVAAVGPGDGRGEGVEVHDQQVDRLRCRARAITASSMPRRPSRPPWIFGCSVLTRPSMISGKPV